MKNINPTDAFHKLHPLPCVLVLSADKTGKPSGMTASWFMQTSFEPLLVAVSVGKTRYTYNLIKESKEFVIAVPNKYLEEAVLLFGTTTGSETDKFKETNLKTQESKYLKVPLLSDATMNHECKLVDIIDTGDHSIFIGEVVSSWINEDKKVLMNLGKPADKRILEEF